MSSDFKDFDDLDDLEKLEALKRHLEDLEQRYRQKEEEVKRLEDTFLVDDILEEVSEMAEIAEQTTRSSSFRERFCQLYKKQLTSTVTGGIEIVTQALIGVAFSSNLPLMLTALVLSTLPKRILDGYCDQID